MKFNFVPMEFTCDNCGKRTHAIDQFAVVSGFRLLFSWTCDCGNKISLLVPLDDIVKNTPPSPVPETVLSNNDQKFLKEIKVCFE